MLPIASNAHTIGPPCRVNAVRTWMRPANDTICGAPRREDHAFGRAPLGLCIRTREGERTFLRRITTVQRSVASIQLLFFTGGFAIQKARQRWHSYPRSTGVCRRERLNASLIGWGAG